MSSELRALAEQVLEIKEHLVFTDDDGSPAQKREWLSIMAPHLARSVKEMLSEKEAVEAEQGVILAARDTALEWAATAKQRIEEAATREESLCGSLAACVQRAEKAEAALKIVAEGLRIWPLDEQPGLVAAQTMLGREGLKVLLDALRALQGREEGP